MSVQKKARKPAVTVSANTTVMEAVRMMRDHKVGATAVVDKGRVLGVFTERDVMIKVVLEKRNAETTPISQVMTAPAVTIEQNADMGDALQIMLDRHIRHLPVTDHEGKIVGMLSMRHLMREQIEALKLEVGSLANYIGSDGPGG